MSLHRASLKAAFQQGKTYTDNLTIRSSENLPSIVLGNEGRFFSWDNEKRSPAKGHPYLYSWSYYIGVVMEGLMKLGQAQFSSNYHDYVRDYTRALITNGELNEKAGYVVHHGLDCYKTAALLQWFPDEDECQQVANTLFHDLHVTNHKYTEDDIGGNYWHNWYSKQPPRFRVWLDGLYMAQPFLAHQAAQRGDEVLLHNIALRFFWVHENLRSAQTGLLHHAGNSTEDACPFFWLRAMGWYMMAQVDVMPYLSKQDQEVLLNQFTQQMDAILDYADEATGLWTNLIDQPVTDGNRLETSGSSMMIYALLKAVRLGWAAEQRERYLEAATKAYISLVELKLKDDHLSDIYLMANANGSNNYENIAWYLNDEGKGVGPFIMATAEISYLLQ